MAETLRIGLIGAGANTRTRHIPGFQAIEGVELVAVCNRSPESGHRVADAFGIGRVETDPEALFRDPDIDAICIGTWPYKHREFVVRALEAGKHVLTEARMAMNAAEAREMLAASKAHPKLVAQIVPGPPELKSWRTVKRMVADGTLGDIREVHVTVLSGSNIDPSAPLHWRERTEFSGVNVMSYGIYTEVITRWLGPTKRILADGATFIMSRVDTETGVAHDIEVPDSLGVFATLESGARVTYRFSTVTPNPVPATGGISIYGSNGTLHWEIGDKMQFAPVGGALAPLSPDAGTDIDWRVEADFVDSIRTGAPVTLTNFEDGLNYMRMLEATQKSRLEGRAVDLSEV